MISASMVKELRNSTGAGMMDCKKALVEADGNMAKAIDILREKGLSQAAKKASRIAAEGAVVSYISENGKIGVITEVNCETDFVGHNENFQALAKSIAVQIASVNPADVAVLLDSAMGDKTVKDVVTEAIANIGENISIRRFTRYESTEGQVYSYIHGGGKIGVLVEIKDGDAELGKDIAMQVAAANPSYLERSQVSKEELEHEKEVLREQARNEGKPENVVEKWLQAASISIIRKCASLISHSLRTEICPLPNCSSLKVQKLFVSVVSSLVKALKRNRITWQKKLQNRLISSF